MKKVIIAFIFQFLLIFLPSAVLAQIPNTYYVDPSGSNSNSGTSMSSPWRDFTNLVNRTLLPGEKVLLKKGGVWNQEMEISGKGTLGNFIEVGVYGTGAKPKICRNSNTEERALTWTNPSYVKISGLELCNAGAGIVLYYTADKAGGYGNSSVHIDDIVGHHLSGIYMGVGNGVSAHDHIGFSFGVGFGGTDINATRTNTVLEDLRVTNSEFYKCGNGVTINWFYRPQDPVWIQEHKFKNVLIDNCNFHDNDTSLSNNSIHLQTCTGCTIRNSIIDKGTGMAPNGTAGIMLGDDRGITIDNVTIKNTPFTSSTDNVGIDFESNASDVVIQNSRFENNAGPAINILPGPVTGSKNIEIKNSTFIGNDWAQKFLTDPDQLASAQVTVLNFPNPPNLSSGSIHDNSYRNPENTPFFATKADPSLFTLANNSEISAPGNWHLSNWSYRQSFAISQLRSDNLAFIVIPETSQIFPRSKDDGSDIRVVDSAGGNLPFVIKEWSKQHKKGLVVAKLNSASNTIYIYTGNPDAPNAQSPNQVYLVYDAFSGATPSGWTILNNPGGNSVNIKPTSWIPSWTIPLFSGTQRVNVGPGSILDNGTIVAASVDTGEIKKSDNQGNTWQTIPISYPANPSSAFDKSKSPHIFLSRFFFKDSHGSLYTSFDGSNGIFRSPDQGQTWTKVLDFGPFFECCTCSGCWQYCENCSPTANPPCTGASCSGPACQERLTIAKSANPDSYLFDCASGLENGVCLPKKCASRCKMGRMMTEFSNGTLLVGSYTGGNLSQVGAENGAYIFKSTNQGLSWTKVWNDNPNPAPPYKPGRHVHFVAADPYHPGRAYAAIGDGSYKAKIIRSDDYGDTWHIIKQEGNLLTADYPYWQPTTVAFDQNCRLYGGDNEWDPVIHKSCDPNEQNFEIVFRPRNQYGYYYWSGNDDQNNHYFGFLADPIFSHDEKQLDSINSFVVGTATKGDFWQTISYLGDYRYPFHGGYSGSGGTYGGSNFVNNVSLVSTLEKKPYLLKVETNMAKRYLEAKPGADLQLNLPSLQGYESVALEFTMAMKSSSSLGPNDPIPASKSLILADGSGDTQAGIVIQARDGRPDLWYIYEDASGDTWTGKPFSLDTWVRMRYEINLSSKTWRLCLPEYGNYCGNELNLSNANSLPAKLILRSGSSTITNVLMDVSLGANTSGTNIATAGLGEVAPTVTPTPACQNGEKGDLNCNGVINSEDLSILNSAWAPVGPVVTPPDARRSPDLNGDNKVDEIDLTTLMRNWTQ